MRSVVLEEYDLESLINAEMPLWGIEKENQEEVKDAIHKYLKTGQETDEEVTTKAGYEYVYFFEQRVASMIYTSYLNQMQDKSVKEITPFNPNRTTQYKLNDLTLADIFMLVPPKEQKKVFNIISYYIHNGEIGDGWEEVSEVSHAYLTMTIAVYDTLYKKYTIE